MGTVIETSKLCAGYGSIPVIEGLDIAVSEGEIVALLGPNGAGKSTTLATLAGIIPPLSGDIRWLDLLDRAPLYERAKQGMAFVSQERSVFMNLTVAQNARVARVLLSDCLELFPELSERVSVQVGSLSGGEQQMLALGLALARSPKLLLADELSLGLAPLLVERLMGAIRQAADQRGTAILLVEQHIVQALNVADRVYVLQRGRIALSGVASTFHNRLSEIEEVYLSGESSPSQLDGNS